MESSERLALTAFCEELPDLRAECARQGADQRRQLARIEGEAQARRPILMLLADLLDAEPEHAVRALAAGLPGAGPGRADEENFVCPDGACARVAHTDPAGPVPRCGVIGRPMVRP
ncbi:hypothetical protein [Actinoplanes sp. NPDC026623]|uniref:hypothetical protein n=1 Tax=Actinoplanes sp. NPDC026623 TaxID=3155610 RepID=UPI0033C9DC33